MAKEKPAKLKVQAFADHQVITPAQPAAPGVAPGRRKATPTIPWRAPKKRWPGCPANSRTGWRSNATVSPQLMPPSSRDGFTTATREELFRAAHDIKGDAATFGFPTAGAAAESLCRIIEHAPELDKVPADLIAHHINAILAIVRENTRIDDTGTLANELSRRLRGVADEYLAAVNRDRPEHLEAILAPSIVPGE